MSPLQEKIQMLKASRLELKDIARKDGNRTFLSQRAAASAMELAKRAITIGSENCVFSVQQRTVSDGWWWAANGSNTYQKYSHEEKYNRLDGLKEQFDPASLGEICKSLTYAGNWFRHDSDDHRHYASFMKSLIKALGAVQAHSKNKDGSNRTPDNHIKLTNGDAREVINNIRNHSGWDCYAGSWMKELQRDSLLALLPHINNVKVLREMRKYINSAKDLCNEHSKFPCAFSVDNKPFDAAIQRVNGQIALYSQEKTRSEPVRNNPKPTAEDNRPTV